MRYCNSNELHSSRITITIIIILMNKQLLVKGPWGHLLSLFCSVCNVYCCVTVLLGRTGNSYFRRGMRKVCTDVMTNN